MIPAMADILASLVCCCAEKYLRATGSKKFKSRHSGLAVAHFKNYPYSISPAFGG